ncbi:MAG: rod shape-determining protein RodA [Flavobacteriales bacterium]|jgi:rod shape determining protein RodA|nr:rod shape-determining protein RodA [Flavobacteriales bacterium]
MRKANTILEVDWLIIMLYLILCIIGWVSIYSANYDEQFVSIFDSSQEHGKQIIWIGSSLLIGLFILFTSSRLYTYYSIYFYLVSMLLLVLVLFIGKEVGGGKSWFGIGSYSIQPAEFAKFSTLLILGTLLSSPQTDLRDFRSQLVTFAVLAIPMFLILLQPDAGSALVYSSLILVLYREGLPGYYLWGIISAILLFLISLLIPLWLTLLLVVLIILISYVLQKPRIRRKYLLHFVLVGIVSIIYSIGVGFIYNNVFKSHHRNRIDIILGKIEDSSDKGYNLLQSKIAIGSGGVVGQGFLEGTQTRYNFVPEQSTDFIFCTIGEEWGLLGSLVLMVIFLGLIYRIILLSERQKSAFTRVYGYGVASILFFHFFVNIGMTIGVVPVIGIPLPYVSYGGSSLWGFTILLFIFLRLASERKEIL